MALEFFLAISIQKLQLRIDTYHSNQGKNRGHLEQLGLDFHGVEMDGRNLAAAVIPAADFSGMTLRDVDFAGANLGGDELLQCNPHRCYFCKGKS